MNILGGKVGPLGRLGLEGKTATKDCWGVGRKKETTFGGGGDRSGVALNKGRGGILVRGESLKNKGVRERLLRKAAGWGGDFLKVVQMPEKGFYLRE